MEIAVSEKPEKSYCQLCKRETIDFYENKIAEKHACLDCAILQLEWENVIADSMYKDDWLNLLESISPVAIYASRFKKAIRDGYFFTDDKEEQDLELFDVLWHVTKGGIEIRFKNWIHVLKFIIKHANDPYSGKRSSIVSSILQQGLERQLTSRQRFAIRRALWVLTTDQDLPFFV